MTEEVKIRKIIMNRRFQTGLVICFFAIYFILGIFLVRDYGVSTDEPCEKTTMYVNLNYVLSKFGKEAMAVPDLDTYLDKYYGIVMQLPMCVFEIGDLPLPVIYLGRHIYTFFVCFIGYLCFFFLCKRIFKSNYIALLGSAMVMLYPRFFAEQFYNLKDMIFTAVFMISMWATERLIAHEFSKKWIIIFSLIVAVTMNVRTFGIIFLMLILGYLWCIYITQANTNQIYHKGLTFRRTIGISLGIVFCTLLIFTVSIPALWSKPFKGLTEMLTDFSHYAGGGNVVFMGKVMENTEIPWYYVPVWILISVPIWYNIILVVTGGISGSKMICAVRNKQLIEKLVKYRYLLWAVMLFFIPWFGIAILGSTLYNGWRHCYFMLPPMILASLFGIQKLMREKKTAICTGIFIAAGLMIQCGWIIKNHPYEMVYFNEAGRNYAAEFDRDYWHLSELQAWKYISQKDDSDEITVNTSGYQFFTHVLDKDEKPRAVISDDPKYYIETYRGVVGNQVDIEGYEEIYAIIVDGFKVASVFRKV